MQLKIKNNRSGFTLIELLVVIAIIGLLASVITVAAGSARLKSRDAKRLSDMQQIKSGLDIYYNLGFGYPATAGWNTAQSNFTQVSCSGTPALKVPQDPLNATTPTYTYTYTQGGTSSAGCGGTVYSNYKVQFKTEGATSIGAAGTYYLSASNGITSTAPF
ncbi:MAG: hypothetical protein A3J07_05010 [Candidatus Doudnabacteria bacterium RIFCSPLOWO2_02_FULL_49_13]|uniref:Type II secretion system protein GspG C-terminal domain-containing protein n=1 Tax=Candidatus Doudnabacteria bacterium RIFCSPHIGHO2_12_FULL_48_16 TaxID=1817838 RepID=A0A1F5PKT9_9BACT|nr:MAG: hypothetical protein A3B77_04650 [Candidatus Doudnabacteria bacterium RIFCSPHIGHO2_02_FULL_49_24]OGE88178.1 MAG: hypothetical protein A2760_02300 [Candidatus Doudnabacteria bacterium RIFCSPHIGHO2_01_FULL_50_67]OGE90487.1 MAG: hypothetical protein A3E29_05080 [Candidatus Doudnabacteria bacterium RIFCSPHIGHO2_12_FULL_48_16]OGE96549.1 MAG: hypothetical protein A2990_03525 [Candidatus Doudnabacteria bacterium RIFCSPLOWO2_01_FULL_49_40]OGF02679.1 MAG: hypothetical protein A3H14_03390 [Candid